MLFEIVSIRELSLPIDLGGHFIQNGSNGYSTYTKSARLVLGLSGNNYLI
jgi:hypothetical protein